MTRSRFHELKPSNMIILVIDLLTITGLFVAELNIIERHYYAEGFDYTNLASYTQLPVFLLPLLMTILAVGLYNVKLRETFRGIIVRLLVATLLAYFVTTIFYGITGLELLPGQFNRIFFPCTFGALVLSRYLVGQTQYKQVGRKRTLVLGTGKRASIIEKSMRRQSDRIGIEFVGFVPMQGDCEIDGIKKEKIIELKGAIESFVAKYDIKELVIAPDERRNVLPNDSLFKCRQLGVKVTDIVDFVERETGQIAVHHIYPSWIIYSPNKYANKPRRTLDWLFNCSIAMVIFSVTWPVMLITALMIKLEDGIKAPVLYSQTRTGLNGKHFSIYKFRSMGTDAEKDGAKWAQKQDPRVTKVGGFIRKYRIDELPQLFNVINGDMGFVGPRPERPQFCDEFEESIPFYNHRLNVKPGLTGWAQLKYPYGSSHNDTIEKLKFDLYYIKHRGLLLDLLILLRTSEIILFGKGR